jgi:HlyD family secretion protein
MRLTSLTITTLPGNNPMVLQLNQPTNQPPQQGKLSPLRRRSKPGIEQPNSPEQLDIPIKIVSPQRWLALLGLGTIVIAAATFSIYGKIPITVTGKGTLSYDRQIMGIQSPSSGRIEQVKFKPGDLVKKGETIAKIDQSELKQQFDLAQNKLTQLKFQDESAQTAQAYRDKLEQTTAAQQRQSIQQEIQNLQNQAPALHNSESQSIQQERESLQKRLAMQRQQAADYAAMWTKLQIAREAFPESTMTQKQYEYIAKPAAEVQELETRLQQLDVKEANAQQQYSQSLNKINELQAQLRELDSKQAGQTVVTLAERDARRKEIQETERTISQLQLQLQQNTEIKSEHDGYIQELNINPGQRIELGASIGMIAATQAHAKLRGIAFLPINVGKKVQQNMPIQTTPTIVQREEYGGIKGRVIEISRTPISPEGAAQLVGNPAILSSIMDKQEAYIAIVTELETLPNGQFRWSSSNGPTQPITEGTTTTVMITTAEVSPVTYVMPFLKSLLGQSR